MQAVAQVAQQLGEEQQLRGSVCDRLETGPCCGGLPHLTTAQHPHRIRYTLTASGTETPFSAVFRRFFAVFRRFFAFVLVAFV
eukprot:COSAG06_NODE_4646_length_4069_cov_3.984635_4_plen_83_part_00